MMKQAWRSYVASLHPRNFKKVKNDSISHLFNILWWFVIYPVIVGREGEDSNLHWGVYMLYLTVKLLPALFMSWSNMVGRLPMPKMMYMTPMKVEERYAYIKNLMLIKIGVPVVLSLVLGTVWSCFFDMSILQIVVILFANISIGIGIYVCSDLVNKHDRRITMAVRDKNGEPKDAWLNTAVVFMGMIILIALESVDFMNGITDLDGTTFGVIVFTILMVGLLIGDIVILKTRFHDTLENLCNYEITYRVLGKAENV